VLWPDLRLEAFFVIPGRNEVANLRYAIAHRGISFKNLQIPGSRALRAPRKDGALRPRPLVADAQQFHRPVRDHDPEGGADGALDQMDVAAMGADQFGRDR
jgi:hypothetical protein